MGRMKEIYMQVMHENDGQVPEEMTIADIMRMKELEIYAQENNKRVSMKNNYYFFLD